MSINTHSTVIYLTVVFNIFFSSLLRCKNVVYNANNTQNRSLPTAVPSVSSGQQAAASSYVLGESEIPEGFSIVRGRRSKPCVVRGHLHRY